MKRIRMPGHTNRESHDHILIAVNLSMLGGFLDAYTYILKGGVFANAQTGNLVLLSLSFLRWSESGAVKYLLPIIFFCCGILFAEAIRSVKFLQLRKRKSITILSIETLIIVFIFLAGNKLSNLLETSVISFLAALQVRTFNRINGSAFATTMITGNLRTSMEALFYFFTTGDRTAGRKVLIYWGIIFSFGIGACIGAVCSNYLHEVAILFCLVFLLVALILILIRKDPNSPEQSIPQ